MSNTTGESTSLPLVSVIIPVFNAEQYIEATLDSVFAQTYSNLQVIVVDDGSTDRSRELLTKFADKIQLIAINNSGVSVARNLAVKHAKGEWLAFIDADDIWLPNKLEVQLSRLGACKWSHTNSFYIGSHYQGTETRSDFTPQFAGKVFDKLVLENFITTSTVLIHRSVYQEVGGFDESLASLEDWQLWLNIAKTYPVAYVSEPLAQYRVYNGSTSRKGRKMFAIHQQLIDSVFANLELSAVVKRQKNQALANAYSICSYIAEEASDYRFALYAALRAWWLQPLTFRKIKRVASCILRLARIIK